MRRFGRARRPILACVALLSLACAQRDRAPVNVDETCRLERTDPYDPALRFWRGSFEGRCADATTVRAAVLLENEPLTIANFFDRDRFWIARVPASSVDRVLFQIVPFESHVPTIIAAHTQLRFLFKPGAELALSAQRRGGMETGTSADLIISSTIVAPPGEQYSAFKSVGGSYGIATRALSSLARAKEEILHDKSTVRQFELRLLPAEKEQLLRLGLQQASETGYRDTYRLLEENCATVVFDLLDRVHPPPRGVLPMRGHWWHLHDEFIEPSLAALRERGLIDDASEIQPMNEEVVCREMEQRCFKK